MSRTLQLPAFSMSRFIALLKRLQAIYLDRQDCPASAKFALRLALHVRTAPLAVCIPVPEAYRDPVNYSGRMSNSANESCSIKRINAAETEYSAGRKSRNSDTPLVERHLR